EDIQRNLAPHCIILERRGIFRGRDGARQFARMLEEELSDAPYIHTRQLVEGRMAFLEWTAHAAHSPARDESDSFVIEDGWIVAQTIHYTVEPRKHGLGHRNATCWPALVYSEWQETCAALHLWSQIAGKYRLAHTPWVNHSWHATLYVTPRGL